jgi:hypothetical protein
MQSASLLLREHLTTVSSNMATDQLPKSKCNCCEATLDGATGLDGDIEVQPGAVSVCFRCGQLHIFAADLTLREPTPRQVRQIMRSQAGEKIRAAQRLIRTQVVLPC